MGKPGETLCCLVPVRGVRQLAVSTRSMLDHVRHRCFDFVCPRRTEACAPFHSAQRSCVLRRCPVSHVWAVVWLHPVVLMPTWRAHSLPFARDLLVCLVSFLLCWGGVGPRWLLVNRSPVTLLLAVPALLMFRCFDISLLSFDILFILARGMGRVDPKDAPTPPCVLPQSARPVPTGQFHTVPSPRSAIPVPVPFSRPLRFSSFGRYATPSYAFLVPAWKLPLPPWHVRI